MEHQLKKRHCKYFYTCNYFHQESRIWDPCLCPWSLSRIPARSKLEFVVTLVNDFEPLTKVTKSFILDIAEVLNTHLNMYQVFLYI